MIKPNSLISNTLKTTTLICLFAFLTSSSKAQITITPGGSSATIINSLIGQGITVSNVVINCGGTAYGTWSGNLGAGGAGMTNGGIILTTGSAAAADGPNNSGSAGATVAGFDFSDPQLTTQPGAGSPAPSFDNCILEFDMIPTCSQFNVAFVFGSEEYPEFVSSSFNDGFGMFITGPNPLGGNYTNFNFARLPNNQLVSIDNVNGTTNAAFYNTNTTGIMQYDGYTDGLIATINVTPCQSYHIKIIIADAGDQIYDSGLFLGYQSFSCTTPPLTITPNMTPATCGASNGSAGVTLSGGTGPFSILWSPGGQTTNSISNLAPGNYTVTVTDPLSCTPPLTQTITVTSTGAAPILNPVTTNATCGCNGSINLNTTGGVAPYTFAWTGGLATGNPTNVCPGNYAVTVTGANGCTATASATVTGPAPLTATTAATHVLCNGGNNGSATVTPAGGTPPYSYSWSPGGQTGQTASNLTAGTYTVTVTAQGGCTITSSVTVNQPATLTGTLTPTNVTCFGSNNGQISVNAAGGTGTLQYSINGGAFQAGNSFTGLAPGNYTIIIRDANNCQITLNTTITQPTQVVGTITATVSSTCGQANGSVTIVGSGGTAPYNYSLNGGPFVGSGVFTNLLPGSYTIVVRDANNCTVSTPVNITINALLTPIASVTNQTNVSCAGGINGSALIGITGGTAPFSYDLNPAVGPNPPPQASNSFTGLAAGNYTVIVTDANNCAATTTFTITQPTQLAFSSVPVHVTCFGQCNGQITITASNATPPYEYSSNGGATYQASNVLTNLCAGTINVVVRDANGCQVNANVVITQPTQLAATFTGTNPVCQGVCNGQVAVSSSSGGTAPYQYSVNGGALQAGTTFTGLCSGVQNMIIQDANGCQVTSQVVLIDPPGYNVNTVFSLESNCGFNNGSFQVQAAGGLAPYSYNNLTLGVANGTGLFDQLVAGAYEVLVTDANNCQQIAFVGVNDVEMSGVLNSIVDVSCPGLCDGEVYTSATGGFGTISFDLDNGSQSAFGSGDFFNLCPGSHAVTMTDQGFCVYVVSFNVIGPPQIIFTNSATNVSCFGGSNGTITINPPIGGTPPFEFSVDGGATYQATGNFTGLTAGSYNLMVRDQNGCTESATATVNQPTQIVVSESHTDLTCNGNNSGTLSIGAVGGTPPYQFSNDNCATSQAFSSFFGLAANTYTLCVTDANSCVVT
ncbi:MAG: choice-of-anchor L domain-containing protein, partial [Flavobacteriales bacterium]